MISKMISQMFNIKEQQMLEYMAMYWLSKYFEYHERLSQNNETVLEHYKESITDREIMQAFNLSKERIRSFFTQLSDKGIGKIRMHKLEMNAVVIPLSDDKVLCYDKIDDETKDGRDENTIWFFDFNEKVLQTEIIKPTVDMMASWLLKARPISEQEEG